MAVNEKVEIEGVLNVARQVLQAWTQLKAARDEALARDRPAAVGRFFRPILATHSNLFNACWTATGWKRSEKENRVVVALRQYALSILSRGEYSAELWLDGDDHRRWVHAHIERLAGEQVHKTDWSRQAQRILDLGTDLDAVERGTLTACLSARTVSALTQGFLDRLDGRVRPVQSVDAEPAGPDSYALGEALAAEAPTKPSGDTDESAEPDCEADAPEPASEPARRRG